MKNEKLSSSALALLLALLLALVLFLRTALCSHSVSRSAHPPAFFTL